MSSDTQSRRVGSRPASEEEEIRLSVYAEMRTGGADVTGFLDIFAHAVNHEIWLRLTDKEGRPLTFAQFVEAPYPVGIGVPLDQIRKIVKLHSRHETHPETAAKLAAMRAKVAELALPRVADHGGDRRTAGFQGNNITLNHPTRRGTASDYTLARLKRDHPALAEMVISGEMSANAAAIEAGFRKRPTPVDQLRTAWARATAEERAAFLAEVTPPEENDA